MRLAIAALLACVGLLAQETEKRSWVIRLELRAGLTPETMTEKDHATGGQHFEHLKKAFAEGKLAFAGRTTDPKNLWGIVVTSPMAEADARTLMDTDPAIKTGLMKGVLSPFMVVLKAP